MTRTNVIAVCLALASATSVPAAHADTTRADSTRADTGHADTGHGDTVGAVRAAGILHCGSNGASEDYTRLDTHGDLSDLAGEICRAVAVAVLGPKAKTDLHVWPDEQHMLGSVRDRTSDLAIGAAPTIPNAVAFNLGFAPPVFYDGQGLLAANGAKRLEDLADQQVCMVDDASLVENLKYAMDSHHIADKPFVFSEVNEMLSAAGAGRCGAVSGDVSQLINMRVGLASIEKRFTLMPILLTNDPVAPAFRANDAKWGLVVSSVVNLLIQAEASGVTSANVDQMQESDDPVVRNLIGTRSHLGNLMGLPDDWASSVIKTVGNYGQIFTRTLGADSDFKLPRGVNRPWTQGGLMYAQPLD